MITYLSGSKHDMRIGSMNIEKTNNSSRDIMRTSPLYKQNPRIEILEEALRLFIKAFDEYAEMNALSEDLKKTTKEQIFDVYRTMKANYFFEERFKKLLKNEWLNYKSVKSTTNALFYKRSNVVNYE